MKYFIRICLGALFIAAAIAKTAILPSVALEIHEYQIVPFGLLMPAAFALVIVEFILGVWLMTNKKPRWAAIASIALLSIFVLAKISAVMRGIDIRCEVCFGTFLSMPLGYNLALNGMMIALLVYSYKTIRFFKLQRN